MDHWDPIGVKGAPGAADEYNGYRGDVVRLLREGATAERIADHLEQSERTRMGLDRVPGRLMPLGERLVSWYSDSLARWEASRPAR